MINPAQIQEIVALYRKYQWTLQRVLLTDQLREQISDQLQNLFGAQAVFISAQVDALWYSRVSSGSNEAWELRHLSRTPFALIEVFDIDEDELVREERLHEMQIELIEKINHRKSPESFR